MEQKHECVEVKNQEVVLMLVAFDFSQGSYFNVVSEGMSKQKGMVF